MYTTRDAVGGETEMEAMYIVWLFQDIWAWVFAEAIEADADNAWDIKSGMIITDNPYFNCGQCYSCQKVHLSI